VELGQIEKSLSFIASSGCGLSQTEGRLKQKLIPSAFREADLFVIMAFEADSELGRSSL
jgi:hypothetical protein